MTRKLLVWTVIPTHHQTHFLRAVHELDVDLKVHYFGKMSRQRVLLGWQRQPLADYEREVPRSLASLRLCPDWRTRIHIIPGYSKPFLLRLITWLSLHRVTWLHWSEPSGSTSRSWLIYPAKRYYATLVNHFGSGALAIGDLAARSFVDWGIQPQRIRFLPYAVPEPKVASLLQKPGQHSLPERRAPRFLFLGALCHRKAVDILLRAFHVVLARHPTARLDLVGHDHSNGEYHRLCGQLGVDDAVHIFPSVQADQVGNIIAACDVFVLPSRFDGWGVVINEAAALGKAIISTDTCGAAHHLVVSGHNGCRVPANDHGALAHAMLQYCDDPDLIDLHGARSRMLFKDFTPQSNAKRLLAALDSLLRNPAA